jgi:hypothetical protein
MSPHEPRAVLHLTAPVHVAIGDDVLHVRRMGLAMLAYLALEGPTRRERLADVLWGHRQGLRNLRVELHRLRAAFATVGLTPVQPSVDPLALAPTLSVAPVTEVGEFLVGLEDVSSDYQAWIEHRRDLLERACASSARAGLLDALAGSVRPPFVLVVQGLPGSGRRTLAQALAHRLHLPFLEGTDGEVGAVRYLPPDHPDQHDTDGLVARIGHDRRSVWVVGRSAYGLDPPLLLGLRASVPPERWRFEVLRPLTWLEAKRGFLAKVPFHEGAALYLASSGHPAYLRELVALHREAPATGPLPIPQRIRAALALEAAHLSEPAQLALERLSVLGCRFASELVAVVHADAELDELERTGWLRYEDDAWRFADPMVAHVLSANVPPGQRARLLRLAAHPSWTDGTRHTDASGRRRHAAGTRPRQEPSAHEDGGSPRDGHHAGASLPAWTRVAPGRTILLDAPRRHGDDVESAAGSVVWSRLASANGPTGVAWPLPDGRLVAHLTGRVATVPTEAVHPPDDPTVLRVVVRGADAPSVRFAAVTDVRTPDGTSIWLPAGDAFEHWFVLPRGARGLDLTCHAASVIVELAVALHRVEELDPAAEGDGVVVALDLGAVPTPASSLRGRRTVELTPA